MTHGQFRSARWRAVGASLSLALLVGACAETQLGAQLAKQAARNDQTPRGQARVNTDATVAPEEFNATGLSIWDGQTTLQGVWVAHPLAQRARRVRVINLATGRAVEGAMFRRDPSLSGPSILVSSDAAIGLGLKPGDPTELQIVALAETVAAAPAAPAEATVPPVAEPAPAATPEPVFESASEPAETRVPLAEPVIEEAAVSADTIPPAPVPRPDRRTAAPASSDALFSGPLPKGDYLQAGAFGVEPNARILVGKLRARGLPAQYVQRTVDGADLNIVMIGPLRSAAEVEAAESAATSEGVSGARKVTL